MPRNWLILPVLLLALAPAARALWTSPSDWYESPELVRWWPENPGQWVVEDLGDGWECWHPVPGERSWLWLTSATKRIGHTMGQRVWVHTTNGAQDAVEVEA